MHQQQQLKMGVVHLGIINNKHKYMLLEAVDIDYVKEFCFRACIDVNRDGNGSKIFAFSFHPKSPQDSEQGEEGLFHVLLWRHHYGSVPPGHTVVHRNGVTVDNRLSNLELVPIAKAERYDDWSNLSPEELEKRRQEVNLYRAALSRLPLFPDHLAKTHPVLPPMCGNDDLIVGDNGAIECFRECHYVACPEVERDGVPFHRCGRCRKVRYCGVHCQQLDWRSHQENCNSRDRAKSRVSIPSR